MGFILYAFNDVEGPKIETSFSASGKYKGVDASDMGTYATIPRPGEYSMVKDKA